ncbi:MAG TPA: 50S ribosomal protein L23 [Nitrospinaceae bacterium]|jgi:large subunit ribosomal protein L23|nr:50S ribosomal protein L23 [Nitrospinaceae bacterium]MDP6476915.1 50S ribosomal protein L23 [Nitrospinaceae bacterium]MDP6656970.1 50S ribosomal protein L23 [Nitrospinaceae bacterium]MDP6711723.1 50S ribosomal protein L23 [Nitrospinaceae bacterium]MDP7057020.1 50S ribosomal protein L23 [Nitrospinaceae bacterium]|tara:strand:- start:4522 stop:4812 length:291 start_codon:yes stop_codon:yes gene_type:complete
MSDYYQILQKPLVTEKSTQMLAEGNWVSFRVNPQANKIQIKDAVEKIFSVTVTKVNTLIVPGKYRRFGRTLGHTKSWKKAMLRLKEGDKIELFEGA